jgi:hypothetical protein
LAGAGASNCRHLTAVCGSNDPTVTVKPPFSRHKCAAILVFILRYSYSRGRIDTASEFAAGPVKANAVTVCSGLTKCSLGA